MGRRKEEYRAALSSEQLLHWSKGVAGWLSFSMSHLSLPPSKCELACLLPSYRSKRLVIHSLSGLRESGLSLSWRIQLSQEMCESLNSNSYGGAFPIWIRHVTAAPIGVIVVSGLPQEMDHQRTSMPALTNSMAHSCDFSGCRRSEGLYSENGQCCGIKHEVVGVNVL